jgi:hypothetical protein
MPYNVTLERDNKAPKIIAHDLPTIVEAQVAVIEHFKAFFAQALVETEELKVQLPGGAAFTRMIAQDGRGRLQEWVITNLSGQAQ